MKLDFVPGENYYKTSILVLYHPFQKKDYTANSVTLQEALTNSYIQNCQVAVVIGLQKVDFGGVKQWKIVI